MGNPLGNFKVSGQCFITNYKPGATVEGEKVRAAKKISLWFDNERCESAGRISNANLKDTKLTENYGNVLMKLASLSGDKNALEYSDILKLSEDKNVLMNKYGIRDIKTDTYGPDSTGSARIIFDDGRQLRVDFKLTNENNDYNTDYKKSKIIEKEKGYINGKKMEDAVKNLQKDNKFAEKCAITLEKDDNGDYTGFFKIKINKEITALDLREHLSKYISKYSDAKELKPGAISKNNKDLLDTCKSKWVLFDEGYGIYDLRKIPAGKTIRVDINDLKY